MSFLDKYIPRTKVLDDAKKGRKGFGIGLETLIFAAIQMISTFVQSIPMSAAAILVLNFNTEFSSKLDEIVKTLTESDYGVEALTNYMNSYMDVINEVIGSLSLLLLFLTAIPIIIVIVYCTKLEKRPIVSLGFRKGNAVGEYLIGLVIGALMLFAALAICIVKGSVRVDFSNFSFSPVIIAFLLGYMVQGMSEEVLCRGYYMVSVSRRTNYFWAILISSLIFAFLHLANNGVTLLAALNLTLFGIFAAVYFLKRGSIWGIAAIHTAWNFTQGNIFGVSVSGMTTQPSIFAAEYVQSKSDYIWNGGEFGLEGGVAVTFVLVIAILALLMTKTKASEISDVKPEQKEEEPSEI